MIPLVYYDIFSYPLTLGEIHKWSWGNKLEFGEIKKVIEKENLVKSQEGFFYLSKENVDQRKKRYIIAERKFKKACFFAKIFRYFPGIKMIAVCNSLAYGNASDGSDIDFFIVAEAGKVWTARFFTASFLKIFNLRPTKENTRDKICLSFFVDEENLDLEKLFLSELGQWPFKDIYFIYWFSQLVPIYDESGIFEKLFKVNSWIKDYLPNFFPYRTNNVRKAKETPAFLKRILSVLLAGKFLERKYKKWQLKFLPENLKKMSGEKNTKVIVSDGLLKFHDQDRRKEYARKFSEKVNFFIK